MKIVKYLSVVLLGLILFVACQKELSVESGFAGKVAAGSLLDSAGNCKNVAVTGAYIVDSAVGTGNYVTVQVNFTTGGSYRIFTDTQNGFYFQDSGYLPAGMQSIRLKATGKPVQARPTTFAVAFDTSFCSFTVTVIGRTPATYTLVGTGTSCSTPNVQGTYVTGTALSTTNKVNLQVNVTALGSYSVTTPTVGGMTFSGTGNFTTLGPQTITLQGTGTPTTAGSNTIPVTAGNSSCSFPVSVTAGTTGNPDINDFDSAWQFNSGTNFFHGPFFDVFDTTINNVYGFIFVGYTPTTGDSILQFGTFSTTASIPSGSTYNTNTGLAAFYYNYYLPNDTTTYTIYKATSAETARANLTINVTNFNATTRIATGTFSGTAVNRAGTAVPITNGRFTAKVRRT
jgi:hypothetical protein